MARWGIWILLLGLMVASLTACGGKGGSEPTIPTDTQVPTVLINAPPDQAVLPAGQAVQVSVVASDDRAVARIELYVDGSLIESRVAPAGSTLTTMSEMFTWSASIVGPHTLQARAYDASGGMGASRIVGVQVEMPGAPTAGPVVSPAPQVTTPPDAATPVPQPTAAPPTDTPALPMVVANLNANVRSGPGTNYPVVGGLAEGEGAMVTGRNQSSTWWQISYQGGTAWIADSVVTANAQAANAPVVSAPPPPATSTPVPPTATPTPSAPTNTPAPTTGLWADQVNLTAGQCTTLHWNFTGIKAFYLSFGYGYDKEGVAGSGSRTVCPSVTTEYKTTVVNLDESQTFPSLTINVSGSGCGDPWIERFVPTTYDVAAGTKFSIFWDVYCAKSVRFIQGNGAEESVPGSGSRIDVTITEDTLFKLKIEKNDGEFVYASFTVNIK